MHRRLPAITGRDDGIVNGNTIRFVRGFDAPTSHLARTAKCTLTRGGIEWGIGENPATDNSQMLLFL